MQYPGTIDNWFDQSGYPPAPVDMSPRALFLTAAAFDRGPEGITRVYGEDFYKLYGTSINFAKYGQAAIQAANIIDNGGELMLKRVVANDATLANAVIVATVTSQDTQKTDVFGNKLYVDNASLLETTEAKTDEKDNEPVMISAAKIKYNVITINGAKTLDEVVEKASVLTSEQIQKLINKEDTPDAETYAPVTITVGEKSTGTHEETEYNLVELQIGVIADAVKYAIYVDSTSTSATALDGYSYSGGVTGSPLGEDGSKYMAAPVRYETVGKHTYYVFAYNADGEIIAKGSVDIQNGEKVEEETAEVKSYPLYIITDIGRGKSTKRFGIEPLYTVSKQLSYMMYRFKYLGSEFDAEYETFCTKPGIIYANKSRDLGMVSTSLIQCNAYTLEDNVYELYDKISEITGLSEDVLNKTDILFGKNNKGDAIQNILIDETGDTLDVQLGFALDGGTNGGFDVEGKAVFETDAYVNALHAFFTGEEPYSDIYNLDMYKPATIVDAAYPERIKLDISRLCEFRKDLFFFADLGLDINTYEDAVSAFNSTIAVGVGVEEVPLPKHKFVAYFPQTVKVINPFNKKQIRVTLTYCIAKVLCSHLVKNTHAPYCGIINSWVFPEVIEGSVNFTPKIVPSINQKQLLGDMRMNYASILNNTLTMETEYTSQPSTTQLSFINNVIAIQTIIKDVRDNCPKYRYSFTSTNDLSTYKNEVQKIINKYTNWFETLEFVYVQDDIMKLNKIFEANLRVKHKDFVQSEILNIYTLGIEDAKTEETNSNPIAITHV